MLAGELYLASDPELVAGRRDARRKTRAYNATTEDDEAAREVLLREMLGMVGESVYVEPPFLCDYGANIFAGDRLYINFGCVILDCAAVHFGDDVKLGPSVQIYTAYHPLDPALRTSGPELAAPIRIGNRVWIGGGAILCPGVIIGDDSVIGAGSVVTRSIPAGVVAVGNPCHVLRELPTDGNEPTR
ncbi:MAG: sugar O-acetyltransferase [Akkermansiaceae bacterium]|nr:sugar O-acetyltransferase [Armatimonadota bacterium]